MILQESFGLFLFRYAGLCLVWPICVSVCRVSWLAGLDEVDERVAVFEPEFSEDCAEVKFNRTYA